MENPNSSCLVLACLSVYLSALASSPCMEEKELQPAANSMCVRGGGGGEKVNNVMSHFKYLPLLNLGS